MILTVNCLHYYINIFFYVYHTYELILLDIFLIYYFWNYSYFTDYLDMNLAITKYLHTHLLAAIDKKKETKFPFYLTPLR